MHTPPAPPTPPAAAPTDFDHLLNLARTDALKALHRELLKAESPAETRRLAAAILKIRTDPPPKGEECSCASTNAEGAEGRRTPAHMSPAPLTNPPSPARDSAPSTTQQAPPASPDDHPPLPSEPSPPSVPSEFPAFCSTRAPSATAHPVAPPPLTRRTPYSPRSCPPITPTIPNFAPGSIPPTTRRPTSPFRTSHSAPS